MGIILAGFALYQIQPNQLLALTQQARAALFFSTPSGLGLIRGLLG